MPPQVLFEDSGFTVIRSADGDDGLHSRVGFAPGDILVAFRVAARVPLPTKYSIQLGVSEHALVDPEFLRFMNHSCDPTVALDTRNMYVRAIRSIEPGDEITYFYPSTEWSMAEPFCCCCGSPHCLSDIAGATHLSAEVLAGYDLAEHITTLLQGRQV